MDIVGNSYGNTLGPNLLFLSLKINNAGKIAPLAAAHNTTEKPSVAIRMVLSPRTLFEALGAKSHLVIF